VPSPPSPPPNRLIPRLTEPDAHRSAFAASLDGALSPMTGPAYVLLAGEFRTSVDDVASSFGAILLGLGCFMFVQGSCAVKFGHRIVYLCSVSLVRPTKPPSTCPRRK
jgi:MFS family permease